MTDLDVDRTLAGPPMRRRIWSVLLIAVVLGAGIRVFDIKPAVAQTPVVTAWRSTVDPGLDPTDAVWDAIPPSLVQLTAQNVTPPMSTLGPRIITVKAMHYSNKLYINLDWTDTTADETTDTVGVFADAVAVQFPAVAASTVPAICMGQADAAVNIWHWRADSQKGIATIPAHGYVDFYPAVDELHYPAAAALNPMVDAPAVQNLVAGGFGTLAPLDSQTIAGVGSHSDLGWKVTMARPFTPPGEFQPTFRPDGTMDVAFAVWNGANGDRNGQKSVSAFVRMSIDPDPYQAPFTATQTTNIWPGIGLLLLVLAGAGVIGVLSLTSRTRTDSEPSEERSD